MYLLPESDQIGLEGIPCFFTLSGLYPVENIPGFSSIGKLLILAFMRAGLLWKPAIKKISDTIQELQLWQEGSKLRQMNSLPSTLQQSQF